MENIVQQIIIDNLEALKNDLQGDIIENCRELLSLEEYKHLNSIIREDEKVGEFLNILSKKPFVYLKAFTSELKPWYDWLHVRLKESVKKVEDLVYNAHRLGGVPDLPPIHVSRKSLVMELQNKLKAVEKGHYLILHGMVGCGKTTLAVEALKDPDVMSSFSFQVFWFTVGSDGSDDSMLLLQELNARLPDPLPHLSSSIHLATIELNKRFAENKWNESLIILDDVTKDSIITSFDIGAKFLIITKDEGILKKFHKKYIKFKVDEGFTKDESQQLFAKALDIDVQNLPHHALQVHNFTKGHPFSLSLFVSQLQDNKEHFLERNERWEHYIDNVLLKGRKRRKTITGKDLFYKYIEESVSTLGTENEALFRRLAVFQEDVNIKSKVLATLWAVSEIEADNIMMEFVKKSLAVRKWNELQKCFVYGVHDLIGLFLKKDLTPSKEKELHAHFIQQYEKACRGQWAKLPRNDNYIFYYIGYHLAKAEMHESFPRLYYDLEFLEAKLRVTGPADLIGDFSKYKRYISNEETKKLVDYRNFIEHFGIWINKGVNILQAALQTNESSEVNICAKRLILNSPPAHQFLRCMAPASEKPIPQRLTLKSKILAVCFGRNINEAIIAIEGGLLELYNFKTTVRRRFSGHTAQICNINLSCSKSLFLSSSLDSTVRIWSFETSENSSGDRTPSPRDRQESYIDFFQTEYQQEKAMLSLKHSSPVVFSLFAKSSYARVASLCSDGKVTMWRDWEKLWEQDLYSDFKSIDFCKNDEYLVAARSSKILFFSANSGKIVMTYDHEYNDVISLTTIPGGMGEGLALLCKHNITYYHVSDVNSPITMDLRTQSPFSKLCSVGPHIVVTTEDGSLYVLQTVNGEQITYLQTKRKVVTFCVCESAILAGYDDGNLFLYPLDSMRSPLTRLKWAKYKEPVIAISDSIQHTIEVHTSDKEVISFKNIDIAKMDISEDGNSMITVGYDGQIFYRERHIERQTVTPFDFPKYPPSEIFQLNAPNEGIAVLSYNVPQSPSFKNLIWTEKTETLTELNSDTAMVYASLLKCSSGYKLLTAFPYCIWSLDGSSCCKLDLNCSLPLGQVCVNTERQLIAVLTSCGLELCHFSAEDGAILERKKIYNTVHIKLMSFSPSGNKLAVVEVGNLIKVHDCDTDRSLHLSGDDCYTKDAVDLAVSDSGYVCYGGHGLVSIVSPMNETTTAVIDLASIVADPGGSDVFAIVDQTGHLCKVYQESLQLGILSWPVECVVALRRDISSSSCHSYSMSPTKFWWGVGPSTYLALNGTFQLVSQKPGV